MAQTFPPCPSESSKMWSLSSKFRALSRAAMDSDARKRRIRILKSQYAAFSRYTTFHGFLELHKSKRWYQRCIWIFIMVGCTVMLCYQIAEQLRQYFDCELVTKSTRFQEGHPYDFPSPILTLRDSSTWIDVSKVQRLGFTYEEIQVAKGYMKPVVKGLTLEYQSNIPVEDAKRSLKSKMDQLGLRGIHQLFSSLVWRKLSGVENEPLVAFMTFSRDNGAFTLNTNNATKHNWAKTWEKEFAFSFNAYWENKNRSMEFFKLDKSTYVVPEPFLFNPDTNQRIFIEPNRTYTISADCRLYRRLRPCVKNTQIGYYPILCNTDCNYQANISTYSCFRANESDILIELSPSFRNGSIPLCNLGVSINGTFQGADIPVVTNLTNSEEWQRQSDLATCKSRCLHKCESYSTSWSILTTAHSFAQTDQPANTALIVMNYPDTQSMAISEEVERYKWHDIVSNIGGLLGLWLGASVISIFQAIHLCCWEEEELLELPMTMKVGR